MSSNVCVIRFGARARACATVRQEPHNALQGTLWYSGHLSFMVPDGAWGEGGGQARSSTAKRYEDDPGFALSTGFLCTDEKPCYDHACFVWLSNALLFPNLCSGLLSGSARAARRPAHPRDAQQRQEEDGEQEEPEGAERSQEEPGAASRSQGGARRSQEEPGGAKQTDWPPTLPHCHTDCPGQAQAAPCSLLHPSIQAAPCSLLHPQPHPRARHDSQARAAAWVPRHRRPTRWGCWHLAAPNSPW